MKKSSSIVLVALVTILVLYCNYLWARPMTAQEAEMVVKGWLIAYPQPLNTEIGQQVRRVETFTNAVGEPVYYVVYLYPSGFVIVSADNLIEPIICFADDGFYDSSHDNPLGALVTNDLNGRIADKVNIFGLRAMAEEPELRDTQKKWESFISIVETPDDAIRLMGLPLICDVRVAPLTTTKWDQLKDKCGNYCYNYYTPNHYPSGCVATAIAQLMRYHQYPREPNAYDHKQIDGKRKFMIKVDSVESIVSLRGGDGIGGPYLWDIMAVDPDCSTTDEQRKAIGSLLYDAGISTESEYTSNGTGTNNFMATNALRLTFKYTNAVFGQNSNNIGKEQLNGMVNPNLDAGYPVILGMPKLDVKNGHAAVCDGYGYNASTLYHHLNMGWYGNNDVWYNLPNIDCSAPGPYQTITSCIYNIFPSGSGEIISGRVIDIYGNPIGEAIVTAKCGNNRYETKTNFNGIYALAKIPSATTYTISVTKPGFICDFNNVSTGTSADWKSVCGNKCKVDFTGYQSWIGISKSIEHFRDLSSRYNIDVALMADDTVAAAGVIDPNGTMYQLTYEGEGEFCKEILFNTAEKLADFPSGDWVFTKYYTYGRSDITIVHYPYIPLVTQEPNITYPRPNDTNVPLLVKFTWEPVIDQNVTNVELRWEPIDGCGLRGEVSISLPKTEMQYGPVMLSPNTFYELNLVFGGNYRGETSDDIHYVVDADSEQRYWFRTRAE